MEQRIIPGHPNYLASDDGEVWSIYWGLPARRMIGYTKTQDGYTSRRVRLGSRLTCKVAVLVCMTFHGPRPDGHEVAHLDGDPMNNRADNLAWKTHVDNERDKIAHGTQLRGERVHWAKLTREDVREIRRLHAKGALQADLSAQFNVSQPNISMIVSRRTWAWLD